MKRYLLLLAAVLTLVVAGAQEDGQPRLLNTFVPDRRVFNFGTIAERDGKVSHVFRFRNTGREPVVITAANAWCGCTTTDFTRQPVRPGQEGSVTVTYNPNYRPGKFSKEVTLILNNGRNYARCWVKGNVKGYLHPVTEDHPYSFGRGLYMSQRVIPFASLQAGERSTVTLRVANNTRQPMKVVFRKTPNNTVLKLPGQLSLKPLERTEVQVSYRHVRAYAYNRHIYVQVYVNRRKVSPLKVVWFGTENVLHMK